jgi:Na+/H+-dicarboxylate symporter
VVGSLTGILCNRYVPAANLEAFRAVFNVMSEVFLRLIRMIIAPLVLSTLIAGLARLGSGAMVGRLAAKALFLFILGSVASLATGAIVALALQPGVGLHLTASLTGDHPTLGAGFTVIGLVREVIPSSVFAALSANAVLQIVVFAILAGLALGKLGPRGHILIELLDRITEVVLIVAQYVMRIAPLGVFGATAAAFSVNGMRLLEAYAKFVVEFYFALAIVCALLVLEAALFMRRRTAALLLETREAALLGFSTSSSEVAYPVLFATLESFGVAPTIVGFVLPLGYAFNPVGSMTYCAFAALFATQAFAVHLTPEQILMMLLMLLVMSKGIANVPRAALFVTIAVLPYFNVPEAAVALILAVDQVLDMGRTGVNVLANAIATAAVATWERSALCAPEQDCKRGARREQHCHQ